ncbi:MAG: Wzz/FepE/Etk N-terminal domain-containing protein, partial [Candidatus Planktophila sp.]
MPYSDKSLGPKYEEGRCVELIQYWRLIVQNRLIIGVCTLVGLLVSAVITFTTTPTYESQAQIFVSTP